MQIDAQRLGRILEMLASPHEGEVVNAARAATRAVTDAGMTWTQFAERGATGLVKEPPRRQYEAKEEAPKATRPEPSRRDYGSKRANTPPPSRSSEHRGISAGDLARYLRSYNMRSLTDWEKAFTFSLLQRGEHPSLTEKEWACLWKTGERVGAIIMDEA